MTCETKEEGLSNIKEEIEPCIEVLKEEENLIPHDADGEVLVGA